MASLASGGAWFFLGVNNGGALHLRLGFLATILTGIVALAVGVFVAGYLWLALDLRSTPDGVDPADRQFQLFVLWLGIPLGVLAVCGVVALLSIVVANTVLSGGVAH